MAKWGEGDPRWIVEERPDAVNVNNWHWTEKNACGWSESKFKELFNGFQVENEVFTCKITDIDKCEGEAVANNRKGKLIFFYEWELTLKWKAKMTTSDEYIKGKIVIPNLSEENEVHEVDVNISTNQSTPEGDALKVVMKDLTTQKIREQLSKYIQGLKAEFSQGMILPSKYGNEDSDNKDSINHITSKFETKVQVNSSMIGAAKSEPNMKSQSKDLSTKTVKLSNVFLCTGDELYNALTVPEMVAAFTHGPVKIDLKQGGKFELFDGNVSGEFIELVPHSKIVQTWRCKKWPADHYSVVTFDIVQQDDHTQLKIYQTGVPQEEADNITDNWDRYYIEALKSTFGFGYFL